MKNNQLKWIRESAQKQLISFGGLLSQKKGRWWTSLSLNTNKNLLQTTDKRYSRRVNKLTQQNALGNS